MSAPRPPSREPQDPGPRTSAALALATGVAVLLVIQLPRLRRGPLPEEVLDPTLPPPWRVALWSLFAVVVCALTVASLRPLRRVAGAFGGAAAGALAAALAGWGLGAARGDGFWAGSQEALVVVVGLVAGLGAPLLRDRGMLALLTISLALAGLTAAARRAALEEAGAAGALARLERIVDESGHRRLVLAVEPTTPIARLQALARRRPGIDLLCAPRESEEVGELAAAGWPVISAAGRGVLRPPPPEPAVRIAAAARLTPERGPVVVVTEQPAPERLRLVVVTAAGLVQGPPLDASRGVWLGSPALALHRARVAPLPPHSAVAVRAKSDLPRASTSWFVLRLPMSP